MASAASALALLALAPAAAAAPVVAAPEPPRPDGAAWLLVDAADGASLSARAAARSRPIASATKLMTAYVAFRELKPAERVVAPDYAAAPGESLLGLRAGERVSVSDLLHGLLMASGNDAAAALAEGTSGSVSAFVAEMNSTAEALGLAHTSYANPIGLDDPLNYSSAADLVDLTLRLRRERLFRRIVDTAETTLRTGARPRPIVNRNTLLARFGWLNGVKTGYTGEAGYVLVASATREGVTLVSALLGAPSEAARDAGTEELLRYGFSLYDRRTVVRAGEPLAEPELRYRETTLPLEADGGVRVTVRRGQTVQTQVEAPAEVEGPVRRGDRLGGAVVLVDGEPAGRVDLVAAHSAPGPSFLDRADSALPGPRWAAIALPLAVGAAIVIGIAAAVGRRRYRR